MLDVTVYSSGIDVESGLKVLQMCRSAGGGRRCGRSSCKYAGCGLDVLGWSLKISLKTRLKVLLMCSRAQAVEEKEAAAPPNIFTDRLVSVFLLCRPRAAFSTKRSAAGEQRGAVHDHSSSGPLTIFSR